MRGCLFGITPELIDEIEAVSELGLGVWLMMICSHCLRIPIAGCPGLEETWSLTAQAIRDVIESCPQIRGLVFRYGEKFESQDSAIKRVGLFDCQCIDCSSMDEISRRRKVIELLESVVCREEWKAMHSSAMGFDFEEGVHANRILQSKVLSKWGGDPRFFVSIKHTMTDYWRHQPWNPSMTESGPARLVEFQCEREYEFIGMVPNWMGPEWSQGPIECGERLDAPDLANHAP